MIHVALVSAHPTEAEARAEIVAHLQPLTENTPYLGIWRMPPPYGSAVHVFGQRDDLGLAAAGWTREGEGGSLTDRIIDAGPYAHGDVLPPELVQDVFKTHELNALRDELIELRRLRTAAETLERFEVHGAGYDDTDVALGCPRCGADARLDAYATLADLVRRADEHAEVCR